jgi:septal ring factor EnvC (AmiA/AmiB activator)
MVLHRTASSEPEPSLGEIMARLLLVERDNAEIKKENAEIKKENAEIKKENTEQNKKIAELETELSTTTQASIGVCLPSSLFSFLLIPLNFGHS